MGSIGTGTNGSGRATAPDATRLTRLYAEQLADIQAAESRAVELFPDMAVVAADEDVASLFRAAAAESEIQLARLARLMEGVPDESPRVSALDGYLSEAATVLNGEFDGSNDDIDAALLRSARRSLRYQIASYESACATARRLGDFRSLDILLQSLDEELATDSSMSHVVSSRSRMLRAI